MQEVEVKFLEINTKEIIGKLKSLNAKKVFEGEIKAIFFDFPVDPLSKKQILVRLRKKGEKTELTIKETKDNKSVKIADETEVYTSNYKKTLKILNLLGLKELEHRPAKHRISYQLEDIHFEIDTFEGVPTFLEIEVDAVEKIEKAVSLIGLNIKDAKNWNGRKLLDY